jgi:hypothetical protein
MYTLISDRKLKRSSRIRLRSYYRDDLPITTIVACWLAGWLASGERPATKFQQMVVRNKRSHKTSKRSKPCQSVGNVQPVFAC